MIPIKLTLAGIYSYQEKQMIDFEQLTAARLFGIFGAVGSGKSTILEAIMFALYGQTDRLNLKGDDRNYNMMNLKSDRLHVDFEFVAGKEGKRYRYTVDGKRSGKNFGDVKKLERRQYRWVDQEWEALPDAYSSAEIIIGLPYDHFKRTIIIPQGKFQEFLSMSKLERNRMFKDIYPRLRDAVLSPNVRVLKAKTKSEIDRLNGNLEALGELDPKVVAAHIALVKDLAAKENMLTEALNLLGKSVEIEEQRKQQYDGLRQALKTLKTLQGQEEENAKQTLRLKQYEGVVGKFSTKLVQLADRTRQVNDSKLNTEKLNKKLEGWNKKQREQQAVSEQLKPQHDTRDKKRVMLNDLELWAQVKELQGSISKEEKGEKKRSEHIEKRGEELKAEISILAGLKEQFETQKKAMPDLELLQRLRIWFGRAKELTQQISQEKKDVLENQKEVVQHLDGFAPADWIVAESTLDKKNDSEKIWGEKLESLSGKLAAEMEVIKEEGAILRVQQKLGEHAAAMVEGEPCKLCGSLEHPAIFDEGSVAEELRLKTAQWQKVSERSKALQKQRNALDGILPLLADKRSKIELSQPELKKLDEQEKANLEAFTFEGLSPQDGEKVAQMDKDSVHQLKVLNTAQAKVETQQQVVDKGNQSLRDEVKAHTEASASIKIAEERSRTLQTQIKQVEVAAVESSTAAQLRADFITETEALATLEKDFTALQKDINETKQILDAKTGELSANLQRMKESEEDRGVLELEINKLVKASEFQTLEEVKKVLKISLNVAEEREVINIFNRTMHTAKASVEALQKAIGEKPFDEESYRKLKLEFSEKVTARATEHDNLVKEQQKLRGLETDWKKHQEIDKELEKLHLRETNLSTLSSLFHHEGFLDYIASVYLQQLCNAANARFRSLTQQRLVLEIDDNNEFRVIDALNGGKARSVKTLSGGQMFQASLSLALALSESIQAFAGTEQNFFFLDEGFGTQDKESLRLVFESLKELRKENRVVGLISHVDELQEEIDVCLKVRNDDEIGSLVELVG